MEDLGVFKVYIGVEVPHGKPQGTGEYVRRKNVCVNTSWCTQTEARKQLKRFTSMNPSLPIDKAEWTCNTDLLKEGE